MPEAIEISQLNDPLPTCPRCRSPVIFTGNEKPDLKWTFNWRHHFLCTKCGLTFHHLSDRGFKYQYGTRAEETVASGEVGED